MNKQQKKRRRKKVIERSRQIYKGTNNKGISFFPQISLFTSLPQKYFNIFKQFVKCFMLNNGNYEICRNTCICRHGNELYNKYKSTFCLTREGEDSIYENLFYAMEQ